MNNKRDAMLKELKLRSLDDKAHDVVKKLNNHRFICWSFKRDENERYLFTGIVSSMIFIDSQAVLNDVKVYIQDTVPNMKFKVSIGGF